MLRIHKLTTFIPQSAGRNHHGSITVWHRGGGNKRLYRIIDFKRSLFNIPALVLSIHSDPYRTSSIALLCYQSGLLSFILAPHLLSLGSFLSSGPSSSVSLGNSLPLFSLPLGSLVHNVELLPGKGSQLFRSAGTFAKVIQKDSRHALLRSHLSSFFSLSLYSMATLGLVSNPSHFNTFFTKAGQSR